MSRKIYEKYEKENIYKRVFPKERTYKDVGLHLRIKTLEWLNYTHLEIPKANQVDEMWDLAAKSKQISILKFSFKWIIQELH